MRIVVYDGMEKQNRARLVKNEDPIIVNFMNDVRFAHPNVVLERRYHRNNRHKYRQRNPGPPMGVKDYIDLSEKEGYVQGMRHGKKKNEPGVVEKWWSRPNASKVRATHMSLNGQINEAMQPADTISILCSGDVE